MACHDAHLFYMHTHRELLYIFTHMHHAIPKGLLLIKTIKYWYHKTKPSLSA